MDINKVGNFLLLFYIREEKMIELEMVNFARLREAYVIDKEEGK